MNPFDLTTQRVLAMHIESLQAANQQLKAMLDEAKRQIAEMQAEKPSDKPE